MFEYIEDGDGGVNEDLDKGVDLGQFVTSPFMMMMTMMMTTIMRGCHGGPPRIGLGLHTNRELCNSFFGIFPKFSPHPFPLLSFLPRKYGISKDAEKLACWAPKASCPTTLAYLGPPQLLGLDSNASMTLITRTRIQMKTVLTSVTTDHQIVSNIKLLPEFLGLSLQGLLSK